jgi:hypothetical protein
VIANRRHGCRFIVGDNVKYSQEKGDLWVLDADGKEFKVPILRQERREMEAESLQQAIRTIRARLLGAQIRMAGAGMGSPPAMKLSQTASDRKGDVKALADLSNRTSLRLISSLA